MTSTERNTFLREPRIATLVTLDRNGSPTGVPIWFDWDGERAHVFTSRGSEKLRRIQADPRVCLTIAEPTGVPENWVTIEGTATVSDGGIALARRLAPRYYDAEKAASALGSWERKAEQWVQITITPSRIRTHPS